MDIFDRAQETEELFRKVALEAQLRKTSTRQELRRMPDEQGGRTCLDCGENINPARLAANPEAVRCIECQKIKERGNGNGSF